MTNFDEKYISGDYCQYCDQETELIDSIEIYGRSHGFLKICRSCNAYVGVHENTLKAKGSVANAKLREFRKKAHHYFDQLFRFKIINTIFPEYIPKTSNRKKAYIWLSMQLGLPADLTHIAYFNEEMCKKVVEICRPYAEHTHFTDLKE